MGIDHIGDLGDVGIVIIIGITDLRGIMLTGDQITGITMTLTGILTTETYITTIITIMEGGITTPVAQEDTALQDLLWAQETLTTEIEQTLIHITTLEELQAIDPQEQ